LLCYRGGGCNGPISEARAAPAYLRRDVNMRPNSALLTDTFSLLRRACGAAKRER